MDRRRLILFLAVAGTVVLMVPVLFDVPFTVLVLVGALAGGISNPLYSLLLAYVNDYMETSDMAAASAGLMFINGLGAISGPIITGWMMASIGPSGFFLFMAIVFAILSVYGAWRMIQRPAAPDAHSGYTALSPTSSLITVEAAMEQSEEEHQQN